MFKKPDKFPRSLPPSTPLATTERQLLQRGEPSQRTGSETSATQWLLPPSSWMRVPASSFLITSSVFIVFILDMASPGYASFALIPNMQPLIATLTNNIRSAKEKLTHSQSLPSSTQETQQPLGHENCGTLLDAYNKNARCHFNPKNYSNISQ